MPNDSIKFEELLMDACEGVSSKYFHMPVADADSLYRERVYCYELYHQLRVTWGEFPFTLAGEVDKSGHPFFRDGPYAKAKPDFLVHIPGDMGDNLNVTEVKPATANLAELKQDLDKLNWFCEHANYKAGILLIYGNQEVKCIESGDLDHHHASLAMSSVIKVFHHRAIGEAPVLRIGEPIADVP